MTRHGLLLNRINMVVNGSLSRNLNVSMFLLRRFSSAHALASQFNREGIYKLLIPYARRFRKATEKYASMDPVPISKLELPPRSAEDSSTELLLPFASDPRLREDYITFFDSLRFGKLLGDMDIVAATTGLRHYKGPSLGCMFVTAAAESIELHTSVIPAPNDISINGVVTWTGNSSLEVSVAVDQIASNSRMRLVDARFVMVAKSYDGSNCTINPLLQETKEQKEQFEAGEKRKHERSRKRQYSLLKIAPTEEERHIIHEKYLNTLDRNEFSFQTRVKPKGTVWMNDAKLKNIQICHPQDKNLMGVVFGGFLMKEAFEMAWANAYIHTQSQPILTKTDDMLFLNPVEIGSLLFYSSRVVYTQDQYLLIRVHAHACNPQTQEKLITGVYHFHFKSHKPFPHVVPKTYGECMLYLEGRRYAAAVLGKELSR